MAHVIWKGDKEERTGDETRTFGRSEEEENDGCRVMGNSDDED